MLKTDVFPQIAAPLGKEENFWFPQDLASPRTGKLTKAFSDEQGVCLAPWFPRGADVSPLDI